MSPGGYLPKRKKDSTPEAHSPSSGSLDALTFYRACSMMPTKGVLVYMPAIGIGVLVYMPAICVLVYMYAIGALMYIPAMGALVYMPTTGVLLYIPATGVLLSAANAHDSIFSLCLVESESIAFFSCMHLQEASLKSQWIVLYDV